MPAMKQLHLLITGLCPDFGQETEAALAGVETPALARILGRGRPEPAAAKLGLSARLAQLFQLTAEPDIPIAPLRLRADGIDPGDGQWWCADPVSLQLMLDHLRLGGNSHLDMVQAEADALVASLNQHFAGHVSFLAPSARRWYARFDTPVVARSTPLDAALGQSLRACLPQGQDGLRMQGLMNEIQMLLHTHPVNQQREWRGQEPLNSLWLWGGGKEMPAQTLPARLLADSPTAIALARAGATACAPLPDHLPDPSATSEDLVVVLDALLPLACDGRIRDWQQVLGHLEQAWFAPAWQAVRRGSIGSVRLEVLGADGHSHRLSRADTWKFWRQPGRLCPELSR